MITDAQVRAAAEVLAAELDIDRYGRLGYTVVGQTLDRLSWGDRDRVLSVTRQALEAAATAGRKKKTRPKRAKKPAEPIRPDVHLDQITIDDALAETP